MTVNTLPTSAELIAPAQQNSEMKIDFASTWDFLIQQLGKKSGQGPQTVASASSVDLDAVTDTRDIVISGVASIADFVVEAGKVFRVRASGAFTLVDSSDIVTQTGDDIVCAAGDSFLLRATAADVVEVLLFTRAAAVVADTVLRNHIEGLNKSATTATTNLTVAAGRAADSTNAAMIVLASAITKTTSTWSVGAAAGGKSQTGATANSTWYHWYLIERPDTGVVDVCYSTNAAGLLATDFVAGGGNVPDAYTIWRGIGSWKTNGAAQWDGILQVGDYNYWKTTTLSLNSSSVASTETALVVATPLGKALPALLHGTKYQGNSGMVHIYSPSLAGQGAAITAAPLGQFYTDTITGASSAEIEVLTNTASEVLIAASSSSQTMRVVTYAWKDERGRNA